MGEQGVHSAYEALQNELVQDGLHLRDLIGFVVHGLLGERQAQAVGQGRQQVDSQERLLARATQRFAIERYGGFAAERRHGCAHDDA